MSELEALVGEWLTVPDVAERLGTDAGRVRRLLQEHKLVAARVGERKIVSIPAQFLAATPDGGWEVVPSLQGTLMLLSDAHYSDEEAIRWLFTPDESLTSLGTGENRPSNPAEALAQGHKTEIRRRAQALLL